jgi:parallel beta-helix repeat protein
MHLSGGVVYPPRELTGGSLGSRRTYYHSAGTVFESLESRALLSGAPGTGPFASLTPGQSIQQAVDQAAPGTIISLAAGTYDGNVNITHSGTPDQPVTLQGQAGAKVFINGWIHGSAQYLTLKGFVIHFVRNQLQNENAALCTNTGWTVQDVTVEKCAGTGIGVFGDDVLLQRVSSRTNGQNGIGGTGCSNVTIQDSAIAFNNRGIVNPPWAGKANTVQIDGKWFADPQWEGGGGKWQNASHVLIQRIRCFGNGGPGIWLDGYNADVTVSDSKIFGNVNVTQPWQGIGISSEINTGPISIVNNTIYSNQHAGIAVQESTDALVQGNSLYNDGIELRAMSNRPVSLENTTISDNYMSGGYIFVSVGTIAGKNVILSDNSYAQDFDRVMSSLLGEVTGLVVSAAVH